jgi:DUF2934 family protein
MLKNHRQYAAIAWWFTRNKIGRSLRERYEAPAELPASLLALSMKLHALEGKPSLSECNKHFTEPRDWGRIRERAYEIWVASGYRDGQAEQHWLAAEREILLALQDAAVEKLKGRALA